MDILILNILIWIWKIHISTLKILHLNFKQSFDLNLKFQFQFIIIYFQN
jgi:hypothetical protein